jgi:hypothetical protein
MIVKDAIDGWVVVKRAKINVNMYRDLSLTLFYRTTQPQEVILQILENSASKHGKSRLTEFKYSNHITE